MFFLLLRTARVQVLLWQLSSVTTDDRRDQTRSSTLIWSMDYLASGHHDLQYLVHLRSSKVTNRWGLLYCVLSKLLFPLVNPRSLSIRNWIVVTRPHLRNIILLQLKMKKKFNWVKSVHRSIFSDHALLYVMVHSKALTLCSFLANIIYLFDGRVRLSYCNITWTQDFLFYPQIWFATKRGRI